MTCCARAGLPPLRGKHIKQIEAVQRDTDQATRAARRAAARSESAAAATEESQNEGRGRAHARARARTRSPRSDGVGFLFHAIHDDLEKPADPELSPSKHATSRRCRATVTHGYALRGLHHSLLRQASRGPIAAALRVRLTPQIGRAASSLPCAPAWACLVHTVTTVLRVGAARQARG